MASFSEDVNAGDIKGDTPLMMAVKCGRADTTRQLLLIGADPRVRDSYQRTPLHYAVLERSSTILKSLLCHPHTPLGARDRHGFTAADLARYYDQREHFWLLAQKN